MEKNYNDNFTSSLYEREKEREKKRKRNHKSAVKKKNEFQKIKNNKGYCWYSKYYIKDERIHRKYKEEIVEAHEETRHYFQWIREYNEEEDRFVKNLKITPYTVMVPRRKVKKVVGWEYESITPYLAYKKHKKSCKIKARSTNRRLRKCSPDDVKLKGNSYKKLFSSWW